MLDFLSSIYPATKSLHVISIISWMAGLLYLPRLFVHHVERAPVGSETSETFKMMERKLFNIIMRPAMISSWFFGLLLLATPGIVSWSQDLWIYAKLALVLAMTGVHEWLGARVREFAEDRNSRSGRHYRIMNEVPTVFMILIVVLVIARPF